MRLRLSEIRAMYNDEMPSQAKAGHARVVESIDADRLRSGCDCDPIVTIDQREAGLAIDLAHDDSCAVVPLLKLRRSGAAQ